MTELLLGLDLGTSAVKALLLSTGGDVVADVSVPYPLHSPRVGWSEQEPEDWWAGVCRILPQVLERANTTPDHIAGMAVSGQMHGAVVLDAQGSVVRPVILWNDQRSVVQCAQITELLGTERIIELVANPPQVGFTAPKILWLREHEPEAYQRLRTILLPKDYINFRLTGALVTDYSDASGTLLFDVAHRRWSDEMLSALGINRSSLPPLVGSTAIVGLVTPEAARVTGLLPGTPVAAGGADNACAALGSGVVEEGEMLLSLGTSGTVLAATSAPVLDAFGRVHTFCHAVPDRWYLMGVVLSAGGSLRWFRDTIGEVERREAERAGRDAFELILERAAKVPPGSEGLIFLPYLTGERSPHADPDARGVFFGLSPRHTRAHLTRSVAEGVAFALADSVTIMRELGIEVETVRATGGGAASRLWRRIHADVLRATVLKGATAGPALGAAILAGVGAGVFPDVGPAVAVAVRAKDRIAPTAANVEVYRGYAEVFDALYPALKEEWSALREVLAESVRDGAE